MKISKWITIFCVVILPITMVYPNGAYNNQKAIFQPGSLHDNIVRVAYQYGWKKVVWTSPNDYTWVSRTTINSNNLAKVLRIILVNYPLQAVFYRGNHVLLIQPRTLK